VSVFACNDLVFVELVHVIPKLSFMSRLVGFSVQLHRHPSSPLVQQNKPSNSPCIEQCQSWNDRTDLTTHMWPPTLELHLQSCPHLHFPFPHCMSWKIADCTFVSPSHQPQTIHFRCIVTMDQVVHLPFTQSNQFTNSEIQNLHCDQCFIFQFYDFAIVAVFGWNKHNYTENTCFPKFL
jgi:hypothetical protein